MKIFSSIKFIIFLNQVINLNFRPFYVMLQQKLSDSRRTKKLQTNIQGNCFCISLTKGSTSILPPHSYNKQGMKID